jgi:hypothetical protein
LRRFSVQVDKKKGRQGGKISLSPFLLISSSS